MSEIQDGAYPLTHSGAFLKPTLGVGSETDFSFQFSAVGRKLKANAIF